MSSVEELEEKVKELMKEIEILKQKEQAEEFEYPFEKNDNYFTVSLYGNVTSNVWDNHYFDTERYSQGHIFKTEQEAIRERDKRALLTRFRQFRDKCNGEWKPNWNISDNYFIERYYGEDEEELCPEWCRCAYGFNLFGYFKRKEDCDRAIELFGDEIKRLFVEEE